MHPRRASIPPGAGGVHHVGMTPTDTSSASTAALPAALRLGAVHLTVADVGRSVAWYQDALGLRVHAREAATAALGDGTAVTVVLHEDPQARPAGRHAGLFHYALLYPSREELARAALRLTATRTRVQGASDHRTHEAIYLADPDGNGIELAADRPRDRWPADLGYAAGPAPLDFESLMGAVRGEQAPARVGAGLRMGHLHLHVGDIDEGLRFYRDALGFEERANLGTAAFVSAGGYHHHLGFNVWQGRGVGPAPEHVAGLRHWTIVLPAAADVEAVRARLRAAGIGTEETVGGLLVRDPWETALRIVAREAPDAAVG
jgi:catechol 2,3-dioxygenase